MTKVTDRVLLEAARRLGWLHGTEHIDGLRRVYEARPHRPSRDKPARKTLIHHYRDLCDKVAKEGDTPT
jgi:hypothetical protein